MDNVENFACYLIDNCEGTEVTEELVLCWLSDFIKSDRYNSNKVGRDNFTSNNNGCCKTLQN
jgi:hypothetical protein